MLVIVNLDQLDVAETNEVIIKKLTSEQVAIAGSQWRSMKRLKEGTQPDMYDKEDLALLL